MRIPFIEYPLSNSPLGRGGRRRLTVWGPPTPSHPNRNLPYWRILNDYTIVIFMQSCLAMGGAKENMSQYALHRYINSGTLNANTLGEAFWIDKKNVESFFKIVGLI